MRLWHKDLIKVLPKQQLLGQWRELACIAKNIKEKSTPNHILVNKIMNYDLDHFCNYAIYVSNEMGNRGYKINEKVAHNIDNITEHHTIITLQNLFPSWHNDKYLKQCLYNLQEKYDCGGISEEEWQKIYKNFKEIL